MYCYVCPVSICNIFFPLAYFPVFATHNHIVLLVRLSLDENLFTLNMLWHLLHCCCCCRLRFSRHLLCQAIDMRAFTLFLQWSHGRHRLWIFWLFHKWRWHEWNANLNTHKKLFVAIRCDIVGSTTRVFVHVWCSHIRNSVWLETEQRQWLSNSTNWVNLKNCDKFSFMCIS